MSVRENVLHIQTGCNYTFFGIMELSIIIILGRLHSVGNAAAPYCDHVATGSTYHHSFNS